MAYSLNHAYVPFDVIDYTGSNVLSSFSLEKTPLTFKADFSQATSLKAGVNSSFSDRIISNKNVRWDFGDGTFSTDLIGVHSYSWPGLYTVSLTIYDNTGTAYDSTYKAQVEIYDYVSTQIAFQDYKRFICDVPAGRFIGPLTVIAYNSWQNNAALSMSGCTINLYASGAKGDYNYLPARSKDKWSHLRSLSRFYKIVTISGEESYEEIESIQAQQTEIYVKIQDNQLRICNASETGSIFVGTSGLCQFWYTDDRPGNYTTEDNPIFIFATIDNTMFHDAFTEKTKAFDYINYPPYGFQNIQPAVFPGIKTRYNSANHLSITTTGIDGEGTLSSTKFEIPKVSWQGTDIPFVIKFKDSSGFTTKNYPPLSSSYVQSPTIASLSTFDVCLGVGAYNEDGSLQPLPGVTFYEDFNVSIPQSTGAFYKGYLKASQSSENCVLTASVNVIEPAFYLKDALVGWIAIPQYNSALRILRQEYYNQLTVGSKTVTFTNGQSLFSTNNNNNIYATAVAPSNSIPENEYQTWMADFTNNKIIKYNIYGDQLPVYYTLSSSGEFIPSYYYALSAMPTIINNQVIINDFRTPSISGFPCIASPNSLALDSNNNVWITLFDSGSAIKIDTSTGYVTTIAYINSPSNNTTLSATTLSSAYITLSGFAGENIVLPSSIDIDQDNNAWIAYAHPLFNRLVKYQGERNDTPVANILASVTFPENISPDEICIDRNKFIWVTALNHNYDRGTFSTSNDLLYKFDLNGKLMTGFPLSGFKQIGNLTIDGHQNAWVTQDRETITKIDATSLETTSYLAGSGNNITNYIGSIGGISCDTSNYIWVINNFDKKLYLIDSERPPGDHLSYVYAIDLAFPETSTRQSADYTYTPLSGSNVSAWYNSNSGDNNTNILFYSTQLSGAPGNKWYTGTTAPTIRLNAAVAPDNTQTAANLVFAAANNEWLQLTPIVPVGTYTGSCYVSGAPGSNIKLGMYVDGSRFDSSITLDGTWQRISNTQSASTSNNSTGISIHTQGLGSRNINVWGPQVERGSVVGTYIPTTTTGLAKIAPISISSDGYSDGLQAFQAIGDWNGYRWINKYAVSHSTVRAVTGSSNQFNIYPDTGIFNISKVNESWDASGYYNALRYQESLLDKQIFFDQFLGIILGAANAQPYEIGKTVYEKIANFVDNRTDIDKCNIDALLDFCKELAIEFEEYNYLYPPQVRRLVDMLSIKQSNLWGTQNGYNLNFDNRGTMFPNDAYGINLGTEIDINTGIVYSGIPVVAYEIFSGNFTIVNTNFFNDKIPPSNTPANVFTTLTVNNAVTGYNNDVYIDYNGTYNDIDGIWTKYNNISSVKYYFNTVESNNTWFISQSGLKIDSDSAHSGSPITEYPWQANWGNVTVLPVSLYQYPLSSYTSDWGWCLTVPDNISGIDINTYYKFYNYVPTKSSKYYNNIIDWDNTMTTLSNTNSAFNIWTKDSNGIMQNMLSYELTKGFKLFTSAANITYNS
jgi:PKD domain